MRARLVVSGVLLLGPVLLGGAVFPARASAAEVAKGAVTLDELEAMAAERPVAGATPDLTEARLWWSTQSTRIVPAAEAFIAQRPADPRRWRAVAILLRSSLHPLDEETRAVLLVRAQRLAAEALAAPDIADADWENVLGWTFYRALYSKTGNAAAGGLRDTAALRELLDRLAARLPGAASRRDLEAQYLAVLQTQDPAAATARLTALAASDNVPLARYAASALRLQSLRRTPLELTFTALDGRTVDFASLRGKVVLLDFWATWCGPCIAEMPNIKDVYAEYHDAGFEVIGVSLDRAKDLDKVRAEVARLGLPWPQYLDRDHARNALADDLGITTIPAPFLFDQNGLLISTTARGERLGQEVKRLLAR